MESWSNMTRRYDAYIQWIEYSLLTNIQEMTSLHHGCTHIAEWTANELTRVTLKKIADEGDGQSFDFHQVNYFTCKMQIVFIINVYINDCIMYLVTQIANQGIPRHINAR